MPTTQRADLSCRSTLVFMASLLCLSNLCCSNESSSADSGADSQAPVDLSGTDSTVPSDGPSSEGGTSPALPPVPQQAGVAYVANYDGPLLHFFRTDGGKPGVAGTIDLGGQTHNLELYPYNDLLFVVSHEAETITIFKLNRPSAPNQPLSPPSMLATISPKILPMFARVNPQRHRLYVVAAIDDSTPQDTFQLLAYDISDPAQPKQVAGSPFSVPPTSALALDSAREILFVEGMLDDKLHVFDLRGDAIVALPGEPLDLRALYPQDNQVGFAVHSLSVDIYRNRLYATRSQTVLSELMVIDYPATLPTATQGYSQLASLSDFKPVADPFDVDQDIEQRKTIYDAHLAAVDLKRGDLFLTAGGWQDMYIYGLLVAITKDQGFGAGCSDYDGFGCWLKRNEGANAGKPLRTGGAVCVDYTHQVVVATSYDSDKSTDEVSGFVNMFRYDDALSLTPLLPEGNGDLSAGSRPITAVCH